MKWFKSKPCTACQAKDAHIEDLKKLVFPPTSATRIPELALETDLILGGGGEQVLVHVSSEELREAEKNYQEAGRLFAGTYDEDEQVP